MDWFWNRIIAKLLSKHRGRFGPGPSDLKAIRILNWIVEGSAEGIYYEGDRRHVEICLREMGISDASREVTTPCDKSLENQRISNALKSNEEEEEKLEPSKGTAYRGMTARINYRVRQKRNSVLNQRVEQGYEQSDHEKLVQVEEAAQVPEREPQVSTAVQVPESSRRNQCVVRQ